MYNYKIKLERKLNIFIDHYEPIHVCRNKEETKNTLEKHYFNTNNKKNDEINIDTPFNSHTHADAFPAQMALHQWP